MVALFLKIDIAGQFAFIMGALIGLMSAGVDCAKPAFFALGFWQLASAVIRWKRGERFARTYLKLLGVSLLILLIISIFANIATGIQHGYFLMVCLGFGLLFIGFVGGLGYFIASIRHFLKNGEG